MRAGWTQGHGGAVPNYHREIEAGPLKFRLDVWRVDDEGKQWGYSLQWQSAEPYPQPSAVRAMAAAESVLADRLRMAARQCKQ